MMNKITVINGIQVRINFLFEFNTQYHATNIRQSATTTYVLEPPDNIATNGITEYKKYFLFLYKFTPRIDKVITKTHVGASRQIVLQ